MEDNFRVRVDRAFGSLAASSLSSSSLRSLWSLTDDEVEKREWNRGSDIIDREEIPCSSSFNGLFGKDRKTSQKEQKNIRNEFRKDLEDLNDDDEGEQQGCGSSGQSADRDGHYQEEWEIRSSIALDCTLDNEEEEDEHDKAAIGKENVSDSLYMRDISDESYHGDYLNSHNELPTSFKEATRDPRANHLAAIIRLKEDEAEAVKFDSSRASKMVPAAFDPQVSEGSKLKSILKRKENQTDSKSQKRVRFDPECENNHEKMEKAQDLFTVTHSMGMPTVAENDSLLPQDSHGIPDYVWDPSKYTHYSFDSSIEVDEESNQQAYMSLLSVMKKPTSVGTDLDHTCTDASKSIVFTPKKMANNASVVSSTEIKQTLGDICGESVRKAGLPLGVAAGESQEGEACAMDQDELGTATTDKSSSTQKLARKYRWKVQLDHLDT